ncbi:MAG: histone deacetylase [Chloroflexota bacterium]|nr:MAG: histone deacetylase [Chloroflexota bacterium]
MDDLALFFHADSYEHDTGSHPERAARLRAIEQAGRDDGLFDLASLRAFESATVDEIALVHDRRYIESIAEVSRRGGGQLDIDTALSAGSYHAATRAAGGAIAAADAVLTGTARQAFALGRPPGHHARPGAAMGFCLFNNVAIAAQHARTSRGVDRVAIVDIDVHHGNGTQESFWEDPSVLFISTHQYPFYPGSGAIGEIGGDAGARATINIPLPAGHGDATYLAAIDRVAIPALERFRPDLLLVSAGFDAHWADPLASMHVTTSGHVAMIERLSSAANALCGGRLALVLEGGYNLEALAFGVIAVSRSLLGVPWSDPLGPPPRSFPIRSVDPILDAVRAAHGLA